MNNFPWNPNPQNPQQNPHEEPGSEPQPPVPEPDVPPPPVQPQAPNPPPYAPPDDPVVEYLPFYGRPPQPMSKSAKIFFGILIALAVSFVGAFLVWVIWMAVGKFSEEPARERPVTSQNSSPAAVYDPSKQTVSNTVGSDTNPDFIGIILNLPSSGTLQPSQIYQQVEPAIVGILPEVSDSDAGIASGMILTPDGYLLTNAHVIGFSRDTKVTVVLSNKTQHPATVVGYDRTSDLAVLKIDAQGLPTVTFGSSAALSVGDWVFAIGNPRSLDFSGTLTRGIVSGLDRHILYHSENSISYIQTDAAINPGNSGGALVNEYGQVVGINSIKLNPNRYEGMSFSIAINDAKPIIDSLVRHGYVEGRVRLGITGMTVTEPLAKEYDLPRGVQIISLSDGSPLADTEIRVEDIIVKVDGETISSMDDLDDLLLDYEPGDSITVTVYRPETGKSFEARAALIADTGQLQK